MHAHAQGTVYLPNLAEPSAGGLSVGSDQWIASLFRTGDNTGCFALESIQVSMNATIGTPESLTVSLYSYDNNTTFPGSSLGTLIGSSPVSGKVFEFTASGMILSASTSYFLVLSSGTPIDQGAYTWNQSANLDYVAANGWQMAAGFSVFDGEIWDRSRGVPMQFAIYATPVPEPSSFALLLCGGALIAGYRCRRQRMS
jgi:hypothetical protein